MLFLIYEEALLKKKKASHELVGCRQQCVHAHTLQSLGQSRLWARLLFCRLCTWWLCGTDGDDEGALMHSSSMWSHTLHVSKRIMHTWFHARVSVSQMPLHRTGALDDLADMSLSEDEVDT